MLGKIAVVTQNLKTLWIAVVNYPSVDGSATTGRVGRNTFPVLCAAPVDMVQRKEL